MVASTGAKYVILGHSERRAYYGETVEILKEKVKLALATVLLRFSVSVKCWKNVKLTSRMKWSPLSWHLYSLVCRRFLKIILAYEPVWAIGTGKTATPAQAQEIHA